ncbi:MAG: endonuclease III [Prevotellaceae bacterium]|jgi:endonuclease-3|nr:endonuclease III [Prevotellaceae bacterium]
MTKKERYQGVLAWFQANMPHADSELNFSSPFELLVAVMLSAQCTDKRVNAVTPRLFAAFPTPERLANSSADEVYEYIKSVSYPNSKARHLVEMARQLVENFGSAVPSDLDALQSLQGVGRKTANVVAAVAFGKNTMPVDTHVFRVANRIGLTHTTTPLATERELVKHIPENLLSRAHHWFLLHGRYVCIARKPHCDQCGITNYCLFFTRKK